MANNYFDLTGKNALITGSSQGIGLALARGLANAGASIILNGRNEDKLAKAAKALAEETGATIHHRAFDVTDSPAVKQGVDAIEKDIGPVDILVNNAGMQIRNSLEEFDDDDWKTLMGTNLDSVFYVSKAVAKHMIKRKAGKMINICSVQSTLARPATAPYAASKGAVAMLTKAMCAEWGKHNMQINGIGPGYFKTELTQPLVDDAEFSAWLCARTPAGRWGDVEELAGACIFLASPSASFVNGHVLYVDGGMTVSV